MLTVRVEKSPHPVTLAPVIRNIIFDWCGTLVNDLEAVWRATNQTFEHAGVTPLSLESFRKEFSLPFRPFYERYTPHVAEEQLEAWYIEAFHAQQDSVKPFPHSQAFLEFCQTHEIATFVLSSIHKDHFETHLQLTGFRPYFHAIYVGVHDKRKKIHEVLESHQLTPSETLFVGDMQHDIETAKHGNTRSCGVLTGFNTLQQLKTSEPEIVVEHLGELQRVLTQSQWELPTEESSPKSPDSAFPISTVGALIFDDVERVLMIQTHKWSNKWGIPGGKIQWGEDAVDALRREIMEETNLNVRDIQFVMVQDAPFPKEFYRKEHFLLLNYTCRCVPPVDTVLNHEAQEFRWVSLSDALRLDLNEPTRTLINEVIRQNSSPTDSLMSPLTDKIIIEDLEVRYRVGVQDAERASAQRLLISLTIHHPFDQAQASDDLSKTIDYSAITTQLERFGDNREWKLIERLANDIATWVVEEFHASRVEVQVKKFIIPNTKHIAVRVTRTAPLV